MTKVITMGKICLGVLASGGGTDLQSIIDASKKKMISAGVVAVISDKKDAYALKRAKKHNISSFFIDPKDKTRKEHEVEIDKIFSEKDIDCIVEAGYMRMLTSWFIDKWYGKLINIHPALLPSFKGVNGQGDALDYGVKISGCTTHFTDVKMDHGPIILQAAVKVMPDDDRDKLAKRILDVEHQILPRTIDLFSKNKLRIEGRKVFVKPDESWTKKYKTIPNVLYSEGY